MGFMFALALAWVWLGAGCGEKQTPIEENLLTNASFEDAVDGVPVDWEVRTFKGMDTDIPASWGMDDRRAYDGQKSFYFQADEETRRFYTLTQRVEVKNVRRLRLRGAIKTLEVRRGRGQRPQANFALTVFDKDGNREQSVRFYDRRTRVRLGTSDEWILEEMTFRIPENVAYVDFHCVLGMEGQIWFDGVSLEVPRDLPWLTSESENFTFHWLAGSEYPDGSREFQQQLFDRYCYRLGIAKKDRPIILSYFYPDTATIFEAIGVKTDKKSYWDEREVHSIHPVDDHEIIHIITKPYGALPFALTEGTAFYLMVNYKGRPVLRLAQDLLKEGKLPELSVLFNRGTVARMNPDVVAPTAASFVGYLMETGGPKKFLELHRVANLAESAPQFAQAFEEVYGVDIEKAETEWRELLGRLDFSGTVPEEQEPDTTKVNNEK